MEVEASLFRKIKRQSRKYLKWFFYPLIYLLVTGLVCGYTWYTSPIPQRAGINVIFKTISLIPSIIWAGAITVWIVLVILVISVSFLLRERFPELIIWSNLDKWLKHRGDIESETSPAEKVNRSKWKRILDVSSYTFGIILIVTGLSLAIWISRPYITLLLSASKINALEQKVKTGQVQGNRIIIPTVLVDAPILEGVDKGHLSRGVCHVSQSPTPGHGGNYIVEGHNLAEFGLWKPQSFFSVLEVVEKGTPIYVFYNGKKYAYKVKEKTYKSVNDPKLYDITPGERLTLLTCVSTWSPTIYTNRRTVIVAYP